MGEMSYINELLWVWGFERDVLRMGCHGWNEWEFMTLLFLYWALWEFGMWTLLFGIILLSVARRDDVMNE